MIHDEYEGPDEVSESSYTPYITDDLIERIRASGLLRSVVDLELTEEDENGDTCITNTLE